MKVAVAVLCLLCAGCSTLTERQKVAAAVGVVVLTSVALSTTGQPPQPRIPTQPNRESAR